MITGDKVGWKNDSASFAVRSLYVCGTDGHSSAIRWRQHNWNRQRRLRFPDARSLRFYERRDHRQVRTALIDTSGSYSLPALPVGNYELTVSAPGFVTQVWAGITVALGSQRVLDFVMRPGNSEAVVRATVP